MVKADRKSKKANIAIYARSSGGGSEESIERQVLNCESYVRSTGRGKISLFSDGVGSGNAVGERPGLCELLEKCGRGDVDAVVVEDFDRIARSVDKVTSVTNLLQKGGVKLRIASKRRVGVAAANASKGPRRGKRKPT